MSQLKSNLKVVICFMFLSFIMLSFTVPFAEAVTYTYDNANRLIREEDGSGIIINYIYDDSGHLLQKNVNTGGRFLLTVSKTGTGSGTVTSSETPTPSINCGTTCRKLFNPATVVSLNVTPDAGNSFTGWSGDCSGTASPLDVQMDNIKTCTAAFAINTYTVTPSPGANGTMTPSTPQTVNYNSTTSFTVTPNTGYSIATVSGCGGSLSGNTYTTGLITTNCTVSATFAINQYTLAVNTAGTGSGTVGGSGTYDYNTSHDITATAGTGSTFTGWSGDCTGTTSPLSVLVDSAKTCTATFTLNQYALTVNTSGTGSGTTGGGGTYDYNTSHNITATASTGSTFTGWSGDCTGTTSPLSVLVDSAKTCTATFTLNQYALTVNQTGTGSGTTGGGGTYDYGTNHNITATAGTGSTFTGWSGDCTGTTSPLSVLVDRAKTCTATFTLNTYMVTASATNGTATPGTQTINYGSTANVTGSANANYYFTGVSGCNGTTQNNTNQTITTFNYTTGAITGNCTVTATYAIKTYTVTATATNGTATPATQTINYGSTASVSGTANANYYFTGISGCGGTTQSNTNQSVTTFNYTTGAIAGNCFVTATYAIKTYTVTPSPGANGSMTPSTPQTVNYNSTTSFTVTPNTGYSIATVSGCSGTWTGSNPYNTGAITANCTVSATFTVTPAVAALDNWTHSYSGAPGNTSGTITAGSFTVSSGPQRVLLVSVVMETGNTASPTISATYGGTTLTQIKVTAGQKENVWMGYLKEAQIGSGSKALAVTYSNATGNVSSMHVKWSSYTGVNQTTPYASSGAKSTATTSVTFGSTINYVNNGMTTVVAGNGGASAAGALNATPSFTPGTATADTQTSKTFTTAKHTAAGNYTSTTPVTWTGTTSNWSGLVVVSLQP